MACFQPGVYVDLKHAFAVPTSTHLSGSTGGPIFRQSPPVERADQASLKFVAARTGPVGLQAVPASVAVARQRGQLPRPLDAALAHRPPHGLAVLHTAVLGVDASDPPRPKPAVPFRKRTL